MSMGPSDERGPRHEGSRPPGRGRPPGAGPTGEPKLDLALAALRLKDVPRAGWTMHGIEAPESVADHSYGTALLCLLYAADAGVDQARAVAIALAHDLAEAVTGDFANRAADSDRPFREAEKAAAERAAMDALVPPAADAVRELWLEYEERSSAEAVFVRDMNLIDMSLQALAYEEWRRYDHTVPIPSAGGHTHLDEFFVSAEARLATPLGRRLYAAIERRYRAVRRA